MIYPLLCRPFLAKHLGESQVSGPKLERMDTMPVIDTGLKNGKKVKKIIGLGEVSEVL